MTAAINMNLAPSPSMWTAPVAPVIPPTGDSIQGEGGEQIYGEGGEAIQGE